MRKKLLTMLIALCMVAVLLPGVSLAAESPTPMDSEMSLAAAVQKENFSIKLTEDFTVTQSIEIRLSGAIDGDGHTLSVVKKGDGTSIYNSAAQDLPIPLRPDAPAVTAVRETLLEKKMEKSPVPAPLWNTARMVRSEFPVTAKPLPALPPALTWCG